MNLDRTFCGGLRCGKANTCDRWIPNMQAQAKREGIDLENRPISVAQFADHDGRCTMYDPVDNCEARSDSEGKDGKGQI